MSTIASLISLIDPSAIKPWSQGMQDVNREVIGRQQAQTGLIELQQLKEKQQAEQLVLERIKNDPEFARQLLGDGSVLGSLGTAGGPPGGMPGAPPGAITQGTLGPGGVGAPGLSPRGFAPEGATPQQSILASLGPQGGMPGPPGGPPQGQQNPVLAMAAQNPRAALLMQQQLQASQDRQWKLQEQQLGMGAKVAEFVARELQGVTDQASLDQARERVRQVHPQAAAQMPQTYSKEAVESVQQRGIAVAQRATDALAEAKARNLDMETRMFPELAKRFGMGDEAQSPAADIAPAAAPQAGQQARSAPPEYESAITEANKLYPQVSTARIKSIIAAESNFDHKAVSSAGAKGPMQLMDATAKDQGVDDPFDIKQNVRGGTRYYAQMLARYGGDERKALTAYNWGPGNLDKVGGDVSKAPPETQAYVQKVLGGGGAGTGTPQAPATDPRIAQLDREIARRESEAKMAALLKNEPLSARLENEAKRLADERKRLLEESRHQQERAEETPRAVEKETALQPLKLQQQRAAAEVSLEAKMNEPIGPENAINMNLPPQTRWKDVPKDVKITKQLGEPAAKQFSEFKASHAGLGRVLGMLDNPAAKSIIGTLFSGDNAAFRRRAGEWISSVTPQERKFVASLVAEIADIRHTLSGAAVSPTEAEFLQPMMPSAADPDVATVRAKLEALQEWMTRKHDAYRDQFEQSGYRVPAALPRTEEKTAQGSGAVEKARNAMKPR